MQGRALFTRLIMSAVFLLYTNCLFGIQEKYLHFTEVDGLPRNITTSLTKDSYGYIWVGTYNGIARYDGNMFKTYPELTGVGVLNLHTDSKNRIWAATDEGLFLYNRITDFFELLAGGYISKIQEDNGAIYYMMVSAFYKMENRTPTLIYQGTNITDFCMSHEGIWHSITNQGVKLLSRESDFSSITDSVLSGKSVAIINKINGWLFAGCYNGEVYAVQNNGSSRQLNISNHYFINQITRIGQEIWIATDGNGIIIVDKNLEYSRTLNRNTQSENSITSNSIYDVFRGDGNELWIASFGAGLTCILPDNLIFRNILPEKGNTNSLVANEGTTVFIDESVFYFGTNYGLSSWQSNSGQFKNLPSEKLRNELQGTKITALLVDSNQHLWVGTYDGLLGEYTRNYKLLNTYHPSSKTPDEMQQIVQLRQLNENSLLILTQFHEQILLDFNPKTQQSEVFELYRKGSGQTYCLLNSIRLNQKGEFEALISDQGVFHINTTDHVLENKLQAMNDTLDSYVSDFYNDTKGYYWFATSSDGLLCISDDGSTYRKWTVKDGLPSNSLVRIESVDDRYLWISTISGICRFEMETSQILNYNHTDGLPANEFLERSSGKTNDGKIIFGSLAGFTIIDPSKVTPDTTLAQVLISDISFQNQSIRNISSKIKLDKPLEETHELSFPFQKNSFTIHFFTKTRSYKKTHSYGYRLNGLEEQMNYTEESNFATYTNLSPGSYVFEIISTDKSLKAIPTYLTIHIRPPWYFSWYAFLVYGILFIVLVYLSVYAYHKRVQLKREKEMTEYKIRKEHELTEKKLAFFTSISHDLKTPLTLIDAPVNDLLCDPKLSEDQINKLQIINRNARRLYKLLTDLLDFRKVTQKQYVLKLSLTQLAAIMAEVYQAFEEECRIKNLNFTYSADEHLTGMLDAGKIEKILWNLVSNAIKFTPAGGAIKMYATEVLEDGIKHIQLVVQDQGIGISAENTERIFQRFYQVESNSTLKTRGTGIGLSIVKELIEAHQGSIRVESTPGSGSSFIVQLPAAPTNMTDAENAEFAANKPENEPDLLKSTTNLPEKTPAKKDYIHSTLLLVEDDKELRDYLTGHFQNRFKVKQAEDGIEALEQAREHNPDLIITDVQMPRMNGYELCREIRNQFETSHIPLIMLTANDSIEQQVDGLNTGADVYLTKPFEIKILDAQVNSLLENRQNIRAKFKGMETPVNLENSLPRKDIEFMRQMHAYIDDNMLNPDLNISAISAHFAVSQAQLHRKVKALAGTTPNNLIRSSRLQKAYRLIKEEGLRVSEAAYQTGFNDPNYFTSCFKKEFGENPSQLRGS